MSESSQQPSALHAPDPSVRIRPVRLADIPALRTTVWVNRSETRCRVMVQRIVAAADAHRGLGVVVEDSHNASHLIAYGQILHFVRCLEISDLIVAAAYRSRGIGTAMIQYLVHSVRDHPLRCVEIGVATANERALALYRRLGFSDSYTMQIKIQDEKEPVIYLRLGLPEEDDAGGT